MFKNVIVLLGSISACEGIGAAGTLCTNRSVSSWYRTLKKPSFNPPNSVFGPVWTLLYALMGTSASIVITKKSLRGKRLPLTLWGLQLVLNFVWTLLFFCKRSPRAACIEILFLWLAILLTVILFWRVSKLASLLLVPYLVWVTFATVLNYCIWNLNKRK